MSSEKNLTLCEFLEQGLSVTDIEITNDSNITFNYDGYSMILYTEDDCCSYGYFYGNDIEKLEDVLSVCCNQRITSICVDYDITERPSIQPQGSKGGNDCVSIHPIRIKMAEYDDPLIIYMVNESNGYYDSKLVIYIKTHPK